jgi:predicted PurR-regulated permease PerM
MRVPKPEDTPKAHRSIESEASATVTMRDRAAGLLVFAILLGLLYFGRGVLIPVTVALMLSLLIAPMVRALRQIGAGQVTSVLAAVVVSALAFTATATLLGTQFLRMASGLPQYERTIQTKLRQLDALTVGRLDVLTRELSKIMDARGTPRASDVPPPNGEPAEPSSGIGPGSAAMNAPLASPFRVFARVVAAVWPPIEATGIVLVVLLFVLLEHEALRDRFIRLAGSTNIRLTTLALNDAGERLSRFFVSQFAVNLGVGAAIALGLAFIGLPNAMLWGALAALLRFVPYVGIWLAALLATALGIAVVPGWSLALRTLGTFVLVELIAAQAVEPRLYGHATGLSPLSVIVAAIFWSALWGPVGLILSTPLTLCLLVIGRHIKALSFLEFLLADSQALTLPQRLYQRVLSGDADEIVAGARAFLKRHSFAEYCDSVLIPAVHLAALDFAAGAMGEDQQIKMRNVVVSVISALAGEKTPRRQRKRHRSVLDDLGPGTVLRHQREQLTGRWQGPVMVPPGSIMLCVGMGGLPGHVLAAELLVRTLREEKLDARHVSIEELNGWSPPPGANPSGIGIAYVVSAFPSAERAQCDQICERVRELFPGALLVAVLLPGLSVQPVSGTVPALADCTVSSFAAAVQIALDRQHTPVDVSLASSSA